MGEMKKFRVLIKGQNFLFSTEDGLEKYGFYTTRYVEAETAEEAQVRAAETIRNDRELAANVVNERDNPPLMYVDQVMEIESFDGIPVPGSGYGFFPETKGRQQGEPSCETGGDGGGPGVN